MRSTETILTEMLETGRSVAPYLNWIAKTPQGDILAITTTEFGRAYTIAEYVKRLSRLDGYVELDSDEALRSNLMTALDLTEEELDELLKSDLDNFAAMWDITRTGPLAASGMVEIAFSKNDPVNIPAETRFMNLVNEKYYTSIDNIANYTPVMVAGRTNYIVRVMVKCEQTGVDGNVIAGSSFVPVAALPNLVSASNLIQFDNGVDEESNTDFVSRIKTLRTSKGVGSKSWLRSLMLADARVFSVWLNAKGEQYFSRPWGVDVWVQAIETLKTVYGGGSVFALQYAPFVSSDEFEVNVDSGWYSRSTFEVTVPKAAATNYVYDQTIRDLQMTIEDADNWLIGGQTLCIVKKAYKVELDISAKVYYEYGLTTTEKDDVDANIRQNLLLFFTGGDSSYGTTFERKLLGVDIDKSDVLNVILDTDGVDRVELTGYYAFSCNRSDRLYTSDPVTIRPFEYAICGDVTITRG